MKILIGITSSISAYRIPNLVSQLNKQNHEISVMVTEAAKAFVATQALAVMTRNHCYEDKDEWGNTSEVLHIKLAKWCDVCLIAPLTANTLAKISMGFSDNLLTSVVRALGTKRLILAPAMNTRMWENKLTVDHLQRIEKYYNVKVVDPVNKVLADGDEGMGGLADDKTIINILNTFSSNV